MLEPLVKTIEVPCDQREAFVVFVDEISSWWPLAMFTVSAFSGNSAKQIKVDPRVGGKIVEVGHDDTEHQWGTIRSYDPHDSISMDFHIPEPGDTSGRTTFVEVTFTPVNLGRTRVQLTQSNWEGLGDLAEPMRGGYGGGWIEIFEKAYLKACGG